MIKFEALFTFDIVAGRYFTAGVTVSEIGNRDVKMTVEYVAAEPL
jgi:hypothetical protein